MLMKLAALDIAIADVSIFFINGVHSKPDATLSADEVIALFPPVGGGWVNRGRPHVFAPISYPRRLRLIVVS